MAGLLSSTRTAKRKSLINAFMERPPSRHAKDTQALWTLTDGTEVEFHPRADILKP